MGGNHDGEIRAEFSSGGLGELSQSKPLGWARSARVPDMHHPLEEQRGQLGPEEKKDLSVQVCQELRSDGKGEDVADTEECCPDLPSRQDLLSSCGLCSAQIASSCQSLQGGPQLLSTASKAELSCAAPICWPSWSGGRSQGLTISTAGRIPYWAPLTPQLSPPG